MGEYIPFSGEGAEYHFRRVRANQRAGTPHLLRVPIVLCDANGRVGLNTNMAPDSEFKGAPLLPRTQIDKIDPSAKFVATVRSSFANTFRPALSSGDIAIVSIAGYKDYSTDLRTRSRIVTTRVTQLPVVARLAGSADTYVQDPVNIAFRGPIEWHDLSGATSLIEEYNESNGNAFKPSVEALVLIKAFSEMPDVKELASATHS